MLPTAAPGVIFQKLDEGAVLFATGTETYFGLNEVGMRVWELLAPASSSIDDVCAKIAVVYPDVAAETIRQDVTELLETLVREGLARDTSSPPAGNANAS